MSLSLSPRVISIHHDGTEVVQIIDGQTTYLRSLSSSVLPRLMEFYWDGVLVYRMTNGIVDLNDMNLGAV
jgi:hypothetical protein